VAITPLLLRILDYVTGRKYEYEMKFSYLFPEMLSSITFTIYFPLDLL